jgi:hypothetical protein
MLIDAQGRTAPSSPFFYDFKNVYYGKAKKTGEKLPIVRR